MSQSSSVGIYIGLMLNDAEVAIINDLSESGDVDPHDVAKKHGCELISYGYFDDPADEAGYILSVDTLCTATIRDPAIVTRCGGWAYWAQSFDKFRDAIRTVFAELGLPSENRADAINVYLCGSFG